MGTEGHPFENFSLIPLMGIYLLRTSLFEPNFLALGKGIKNWLLTYGVSIFIFFPVLFFGYFSKFETQKNFSEDMHLKITGTKFEVM